MNQDDTQYKREHGMEEMTEMQMEGPKNTLPMMTAEDGPFGSTGMGGMFTILKVMPNTFAQIIKDNQTAWDDMISSVISDPKFDVLFPIIITSVTWELFSNSLQNQTNR